MKDSQGPSHGRINLPQLVAAMSKNKLTRIRHFTIDKLHAIVNDCAAHVFNAVLGLFSLYVGYEELQNQSPGPGSGNDVIPRYARRGVD